MIRFICTLMMTLLVTMSYAQNGGQAPENSSVKIQFAGFGKTNIYNKQSCEATIRVKYNNVTQDVVIAPNSFYQITTLVPGKVEAKAMTNCGSADLGQVELVITVQTLPVKFVSFDVKLIGNREAIVTFVTAEAIDIDKFNVQISFDGSNWRTVTVILPDIVQPNRTYTARIKIPSQKDN